MRVLQILLLTVGLVALGNVLGKVSAQNNSKPSNSNTAVNRVASNSYSNYGDSNFARNTNLSVQTVPYPKDEDFAVNSDEPTILKQISMVRTYKFPVNGQVKVEVIEEYYEPFVIKFTQLRSHKFLGNFKMLDGYKDFLKRNFVSDSEPFARMQIIEVAGFPSPLLHLVLISPAGEGGIFLSVLFGEINGKIRVLTPLDLMTSEQGGFYVGQLGKGNGFGLAIWDSIFAEDENVKDPHRYEVVFFNYNAKLKKFVKRKKIVSKNKFNHYSEAFAELGLSDFQNNLGDFIKNR